jgi:hypothetical protein
MKKGKHIRNFSEETQKKNTQLLFNVTKSLKDYQKVNTKDTNDNFAGVKQTKRSRSLVVKKQMNINEEVSYSDIYLKTEIENECERESKMSVRFIKSQIVNNDISRSERKTCVSSKEVSFVKKFSMPVNKMKVIDVNKYNFRSVVMSKKTIVGKKYDYIKIKKTQSSNSKPPVSHDNSINIVLTERPQEETSRWENKASTQKNSVIPKRHVDLTRSSSISKSTTDILKSTGVVRPFLPRSSKVNRPDINTINISFNDKDVVDKVIETGTSDEVKRINVFPNHYVQSCIRLPVANINLDESFGKDNRVSTIERDFETINIESRSMQKKRISLKKFKNGVVEIENRTINNSNIVNQSRNVTKGDISKNHSLLDISKIKGSSSKCNSNMSSVSPNRSIGKYNKTPVKSFITNNNQKVFKNAATTPKKNIILKRMVDKEQSSRLKTIASETNELSFSEGLKGVLNTEVTKKNSGLKVSKLFKPKKSQNFQKIIKNNLHLYNMQEENKTIDESISLLNHIVNDSPTNADVKSTKTILISEQQLSGFINQSFKSEIGMIKKDPPTEDFPEYYTKTKSDDDCTFSGDESPHITSVPVFNSKKLMNYQNQEKKLLSRYFLVEIFYTLIKYNKESKDTILSYLTMQDLVNLSLCSKALRKEIKSNIYGIIQSLVHQSNNIMRLKIWKSVYRYSDIHREKSLKASYNMYLNQPCKYEDQIKKDLNRTNIEDPSFKQGKVNHKKLFNILKAFSNCNQSIGYAQGLNFIVASAILILKEEEEVFIFIDAMMNKFKFDKIIGIQNNELNSKLDQIGELIKQSLPGFSRFLEKNYLTHEFFTVSWVITVFSNTLKSHNLFKVWDLFLIFGWKFINYFIISILQTFESTITKYNPGNLSVNMKSLLKSDTFDQSFDYIIKNTFELLNNLI